MTDPASATRSKPEAEAADWFQRLSRPAITTAELRDFRAWRQHPAHAQAYARLEATWTAAGALRQDPEIQALTQETLDRRPPRPALVRARVVWTGLGLAAAATTALAVAVWLAQPPTYRTRPGEQRLVVLADGSRIRLNTDTALRVRLTPQDRRLTLTRGEAFFEAAHDPNRPFIVTANGAEVRALGTRFDVRREPTAVRVTLLEGRVRVADPARAATAVLIPNQTLTATRQGLSPPKATDAAADASWTTGRLTFRSLPLGEAVAEVNRYGPHKVILEAPPALQAAPVSGVFDVGDTQAFVAATRSLFDLQPTAEPNGDIRLRPAAAGRAPA